MLLDLLQWKFHKLNYNAKLIHCARLQYVTRYITQGQPILNKYYEVITVSGNGNLQNVAQLGVKQSVAMQRHQFDSWCCWLWSCIGCLKRWRTVVHSITPKAGLLSDCSLLRVFLYAFLTFTERYFRVWSLNSTLITTKIKCFVVQLLIFIRRGEG
jgi:hypothetical protein